MGVATGRQASLTQKRARLLKLAEHAYAKALATGRGHEYAEAVARPYYDVADELDDLYEQVIEIESVR